MGRSLLLPAALTAGWLLGPVASSCANPPATVPAGALLLKGARASASDSGPPLPERGRITPREYTSPYFHLLYPIAAGWIQPYAGPPPSESGYYVLAQIQSPENARDGARGTLLMTAQDMFFSTAPAGSALELVKYAGS